MEHLEQYPVSDFLLYINEVTSAKFRRDLIREINDFIRHDNLKSIKPNNELFADTPFSFRIYVKDNEIIIDSISYRTLQFKPNKILTIFVQVKIFKNNAYAHVLDKYTFKTDKMPYSYMKKHDFKYYVFTAYDQDIKYPIDDMAYLVKILDWFHNIYNQKNFEKVVISNYQKVEHYYNVRKSSRNIHL
jgi:hypothetical protein